MRDDFIEAMSHVACAVSIVTTDGRAGRAGITVSAMSSVSADMEKPCLLVCIHHLNPLAEAIRQNGVFCVNLLRSDQIEISDSFAGRLKDKYADKFDCAEWEKLKTGSPCLLSPLVAFDCSLLNADQVGTHFVIFGMVEDILNKANEAQGLIYANRGYGKAEKIAPAE